MPELLIALQPETLVNWEVVPGTTHSIPVINTAVDDWTLYDLKTDVQDGEKTVITSISSDDGEIVINDVTIDTVAYQQINLTFPSAKTALFPEEQTLFWDVKAYLKTDATIILPVLTLSRFTVLRSITRP